jgi:glycosyltransferase involved in cell wall biosynthesis
MKRWKTPIQLFLFFSKFIFSQKLGYKIIWTAHNVLPHKSPVLPIHHFVRSFVMQRADAVITHCNYGKSELLKRFTYERPVYVIPHGNYDGVYPKLGDRSKARTTLGIDPNSFVYLLIGNIAHYKRLDVFMKAFQSSAASKDNVIIAGRNRDNKVLAMLNGLSDTDERIKVFSGYIPENEMHLYLQAANVAFFSFDEILTSGSVILALTFGLPIVAPALGCLPELINSEVGILYEPGSFEAIKKAIVNIKTMDLPEMSMAARDLADHLKWNDIAKDTLSVYQSCLGKNA